jgi:hypothetical protein
MVSSANQSQISYIRCTCFIEEKSSRKIETHHPEKYQLTLQNSTAMQHDEHSGEDTTLTSIAKKRKAETF